VGGWNEICFAGGRFFSWNFSSSGNIWGTSEDGINWIARKISDFVDTTKSQFVGSWRYGQSSVINNFFFENDKYYWYSRVQTAGARYAMYEISTDFSTSTLIAEIASTPFEGEQTVRSNGKGIAKATTGTQLLEYSSDYFATSNTFDLQTLTSDVNGELEESCMTFIKSSGDFIVVVRSSGNNNCYIIRISNDFLTFELIDTVVTSVNTDNIRINGPISNDNDNHFLVSGITNKNSFVIKPEFGSNLTFDMPVNEAPSEGVGGIEGLTLNDFESFNPIGNSVRLFSYDKVTGYYYYSYEISGTGDSNEGKIFRRLKDSTEEFFYDTGSNDQVNVSANNDIVVMTRLGQIISTIDGGLNFNTFSAASTVLQFTGIFYQNNGYFIFTYSGSNIYLYHSTDAINWTQLNLTSLGLNASDYTTISQFRGSLLVNNFIYDQDNDEYVISPLFSNINQKMSVYRLNSSFTTLTKTFTKTMGTSESFELYHKSDSLITIDAGIFKSYINNGTTLISLLDMNTLIPNYSLSSRQVAIIDDKIFFYIKDSINNDIYVVMTNAILGDPVILTSFNSTSFAVYKNENSNIKQVDNIKDSFLFSNQSSRELYNYDIDLGAVTQHKYYTKGK
jgi:hypothetical protein